MPRGCLDSELERTPKLKVNSMGRTGFCVNRFPTWGWLRSPLRIDSKPITAATDLGSKRSSELLGRRIMVVVDSSRETKTALQWALSHTVQSQDAVVLVYVIKSSTTMNGKSHVNE